MKTKQVLSSTYCDGCRHFLGRRCDLLGSVDDAKKQQCNRSGYREIKYTYSSVRHYQNRQGDPYEKDPR